MNTQDQDRRRALERLGVAGSGPLSLKLRSDLRVEDLGDELVLLDASRQEVHRVVGSGVDAVRLLESGVAPAEVPSDLVDAVDELTEAGVVEGPARLSRRAMVAAGGAVWAAATVTTFALADPAAALTMCPAGVAPTNPATLQLTATITNGNPASATSMYTTGPGVTSILARAWGGGGAGGARTGNSISGTPASGGSGGEYVYNAALTVTECTQYTVTAGAAGDGDTGMTTGGNGGVSLIKDQTLFWAAGGTGGTANGGATTGGTGGMAGTGGTAQSGGNGGAAGSRGGGSGGGSGGHGSAGSPGSTGTSSMSNGPAGGAGGTGTPGGGMGGQGGGADGYNNAVAGDTPGGGGGGGGRAGGGGGGDGGSGRVWINV